MHFARIFEGFCKYRKATDALATRDVRREFAFNLAANVNDFDVIVKAHPYDATGCQARIQTDSKDLMELVRICR